MKDLSRMQIATIKRTAASVKIWRGQLARIDAKIAQLQADREPVVSAIDKFEAPIVELTGGFTSEQVLRGDMEAALMSAATPIEETVESVDTSAIGTTEVEDVPQNPFQLFGNQASETSQMPFEN